MKKHSELKPKKAKAKKPAQKKKSAQEVENKEVKIPEKETTRRTEEKEKESCNISLLASLPGLTLSLAPPPPNETEKKIEVPTEFPKSQVTITSEVLKIPAEAPKEAPKETESAMVTPKTAV